MPKKSINFIHKKDDKARRTNTREKSIKSVIIGQEFIWKKTVLLHLC